MRRRIFPLISILVFAAVVALAQQPSASNPSVERLRQIVTYLASDPLEGRRTGTPGATEAANYIAGEFKRLGLRESSQPLRGDNPTKYFQPFPYVSSVELGSGNALIRWLSSDDGI